MRRDIPAGDSTLAERPPRSGSRHGGRSRDQLETEVRQLRKTCERRELAIERLLEAVLALRRGTAALRAENRELHAALQRQSDRAA